MLDHSFGPVVSSVRDACGGSIPNSTTPAGLALATWSVDGIALAERRIYSRAMRHWMIAVAFAHLGDLARAIIEEEPRQAPTGGSS